MKNTNGEIQNTNGEIRNTNGEIPAKYAPGEVARICGEVARKNCEKGRRNCRNSHVQQCANYAGKIRQRKQNSSNLWTACATCEKMLQSHWMRQVWRKKNWKNRVEVTAVYSHVTYVNHVLFFRRWLVLGYYLFWITWVKLKRFQKQVLELLWTGSEPDSLLWRLCAQHFAGRDWFFVEYKNSEAYIGFPPA